MTGLIIGVTIVAYLLIGFAVFDAVQRYAEYPLSKTDGEAILAFFIILIWPGVVLIAALNKLAKLALGRWLK